MPTLKVTGKEVLGPRSTDGPAGDRYHRAPEGWAKAKREKLSGKELEPKKPRALCLKQDHIIQYIYISLCVWQSKSTCRWYVLVESAAMLVP